MKRTILALLVCVATLLSTCIAADERADQLLQAALQNDVKAVSVLLKTGANVNASLGRQSALMAAASRGHVDVMRALLAAGATVNAQDRCKVTPLMFATLSPSAQAVGLLIHSGADVNSKTISGQTALMFAAIAGDENTSKAKGQSQKLLDHVVLLQNLHRFFNWQCLYRMPAASRVMRLEQRVVDGFFGGLNHGFKQR